MHPLPRNTTRGRQIGCSFLLALVLGGIAVPLLVIPTTHRPAILYLVGGAFALFSLLMLAAGIHQLLALASPITEVQIGSLPLTRGTPVRVLLRQRGPMQLESLRANLVGTKTTRRRKSTFTDTLGTFSFFDSGPVVIDDTMPLQREATLDVPREILPTGADVTWQIEVWGKVQGRADFQHVFPVELV